jgi:hypothetical protein
MKMSKLALYISDNGHELTYPFRECDTPPGSVTGAHGRYELKAVLTDDLAAWRERTRNRLVQWTTRDVDGLGVTNGAA